MPWGCALEGAPVAFPAVLEQHVRCHFAFRKAARAWPAILEKGKCAALQP